MIVPTENVHLHTVQPDPVRSPFPRRIVAGVIVSQGDDVELFAGLFSVSQLFADERIRSYALPVSLPEEVSGVGLATAAGISHLLQFQYL